MTIRAIMTAGAVGNDLEQHQKAAISDSSIKRELKLLSAAINAWNRAHPAAALPNPAANVALHEPPGRVRWLTHEQAEQRGTAAQGSQSDYLADFIRLALHTGMRKGEMLNLEWSRVDLCQNLIYLDTQKNGQCGSVPLNQVARQALLNRARFRAEHCPAAPHVFCNPQGNRIQDVNYPALKGEACRCTPHIPIGSWHATLALIPGYHRETRRPVGRLTPLAKRTLASGGPIFLPVISLSRRCQIS